MSGRFIRYPNEVWSTDLTYIKVGKGFVYVMAIIDWYSRKVLNCQVFTTMDAAQCALLLEDTIAQFGCPALFNTDQGCQCTAEVFTAVLLQNRIRISMDGKHRALDNIFIERFWRSLKYEDIYLKRYETVPAVKRGLTKYFHFYNTGRFHQSLEYSVPDDVYQSFQTAQAGLKTAA